MLSVSGFRQTLSSVANEFVGEVAARNGLKRVFGGRSWEPFRRTSGSRGHQSVPEGPGAGGKGQLRDARCAFVEIDAARDRDRHVPEHPRSSQSSPGSVAAVLPTTGLLLVWCSMVARSLCKACRTRLFLSILRCRGLLPWRGRRHNCAMPRAVALAPSLRLVYNCIHPARHRTASGQPDPYDPDRDDRNLTCRDQT